MIAMTQGLYMNYVDCESEGERANMRPLLGYD